MVLFQKGSEMIKHVSFKGVTLFLVLVQVWTDWFTS